MAFHNLYIYFKYKYFDKLKVFSVLTIEIYDVIINVSVHSDSVFVLKTPLSIVQSQVSAAIQISRVTFTSYRGKTLVWLAKSFVCLSEGSRSLYPITHSTHGSLTISRFFSLFITHPFLYVLCVSLPFVPHTCVQVSLWPGLIFSEQSPLHSLSICY